MNGMNIRVFCVGSSIVAALLGTHTVLSHPSVFPTGTTLYKPDKAQNGYVLFGGIDGQTHLIDMDGKEVHRWEKAGFPSEMLDPAVAGGKKSHVLVQLDNGHSPYNNIMANRTIAEVD